MNVYRAIALAYAVAFAAVGAVFLVIPGAVFGLFESVGGALSMPGMPAGDVDAGLFRALAVAYMYVVTLLAWMTFRRPDAPAWPTLLAHAKFASAALSVALFVAHGPYLVYAANALVDGAIGLSALLLLRDARSRAGISRFEEKPV
jgi:hypothetical protein